MVQQVFASVDSVATRQTINTDIICPSCSVVAVVCHGVKRACRLTL